VEVMAEGERAKLEALLEWCSHGPAGASVSGTKHEWLEASGGFRDFGVKYR
jgi:acylphosphatase